MKKLFLLALAAIPLQTGSVPNRDTKTVISNAYDLRTGQYIYSEHHHEVYEGGKHIYSVVEYRTPSKILAKKMIRFAERKTAPDFRLEDVRSGYVEGSEAVAGGFKLYTRNTSAEPMKERVVAIPSPAVIDGGFDYFIRDNFSRLAAGEKMVINFGAAYQQDFFRFDVYRTGSGEYKGKKAVFLNVEVHNFVLKRLVEPIKLVYDSESKRLMSYTGVSNINDDSGKSYKARIEFEL